MFTSIRDTYRLLFHVTLPFSKTVFCTFEMVLKCKCSGKPYYECIKYKTTPIPTFRFYFYLFSMCLLIFCLLATFSEVWIFSTVYVTSHWRQKSVILVHFSHLFVLGKLSEQLICARGTWCVFWEVCLKMCSLACYLHKLTRLLGALAGWMSPWF